MYALVISPLVFIEVCCWTIAVFAFVAMLYVTGLWLHARQEVKTADREEYYLCDFHGPIPKSATLETAHYSDTQLGIPIICPLCFTEKFRKAEEQLRKERDDADRARKTTS